MSRRDPRPHVDPRLATLVAASLAGLVSLACNFQIPEPTYLHATRLLTASGEVVSFGPLNPDRIGVGTTAVNEAMPGDLYRFEMVVVDPDGRPRPAEQLDSLWFQCGLEACIDETEPMLPCAELDDWSLDSRCELGAGDGQFEFEIAGLGPKVVEDHKPAFFGVVGYDGRSARDCWESRLALEASLASCGFIKRRIAIGPTWWMLAYADSEGFVSPVPIEQFPAPVFYQFANRRPRPEVTVAIDGELAGTYPETEHFRVTPGALVELEFGYELGAQYLQSYFEARHLGGYWWFVIDGERLSAELYTTGDMHLSSVPSPTSVRLPPIVVDELAEPGSSRVLIIPRDDRFSQALETIAFEIEAEP